MTRHNCSDCGLPLTGKVCEESTNKASRYDDDGNFIDEIEVAIELGHPGICCDCFDEGWGMSEKYRTRPRP